MIAAALAFAVTALAQTPEEILDRMEKAMEKGETEGISIIMDLKIPILGTTTSSMYMLGDKVKTETAVFKEKIVTFNDGETEYEYEPAKNKITIKTVKLPGSSDQPETSDAEDNMSLFDGITQDYDVRLDKETSDAWHIRCDRKKTCKDKDAPKRMDLVVSKQDNLPVSLSTTVSGVKVTMRDVKLGVSEKDVTFDISDYPGAVIEDQRLK